MLDQQIENIQNKELGVEQDKNEVYDNINIWELKQKEILDLKFILSFLVIMCPKEFHIQIGSISNLKSADVDEK